MVVHLDAGLVVSVGCYGVKAIGEVAVVPKLFVLPLDGGVVPEMLQRTAPSVAAGVVLHMIVGHYGLLFARGVSLERIDQEVCGQECACGTLLLCALIHLTGEAHRVCTIRIDIFYLFQHILAGAGKEKQHTECCQSHADPGKHQCIGYFCTVVHLGWISFER